MIRYKNARQIERIRESCELLSAMYGEMAPLVREGVETLELDRWAQSWIKKTGGRPAFLGYGPRSCPFPGALCVSINEEVIHGIPSRRKLQSGDLVSIDSGIILDGFVSDKSVTFEVGQVSAEAHRLNMATRECLYKGIAAAKAGERLHAIGRAVEGHARAFNYGIVREFCGHGVGFDVHEDPSVHNYAGCGPNPRLRAGMVLAIEPMVNMGSGDINVLDDTWTVVTADGKPSAHWEHTIAIFDDHTEILTKGDPTARS
ncbi:MAG: type I methionyl aminopeptidase [Spirochaetaceae bacterium]|jgi:methionyl aminopeptidase|nr:type I methionyl aminopeptidase [Spirochaetaceae bacterium]